MSMSDPLADMLTRIRNGVRSHFRSVEMPLSNLKVSVAKVLQEQGYITSFDIINQEPQGVLKINLKYGTKNEQVISGLRRISKPGYRQYKPSNKIPMVMSGLGIAILSTSKGVLADKDARVKNVGGEILCEIW